jgi:hypothetical protein
MTRINPGVVETGEQLVTGVIDTGDKQSFVNISANFQGPEFRVFLKWLDARFYWPITSS